MLDRVACSCQECRDSCRHRPGLAMPEEISLMAALAGMSITEFFKTRLVVDYWYHEDGRTIWMLSPAVHEYPSGQEAAFDPRGTCVLLKDDRCTVHESKPHECAISRHDRGHEDIMREREAIAAAWDRPEWQELIQELLGREPEEPVMPSLLEQITLLFDH